MFNLSLHPTCHPTPSLAESCTAALCWFYAAPAEPPCPPLGPGQNVSQSLEPPAANCTSRGQGWMEGQKWVTEVYLGSRVVSVSTCTAILIPSPQCTGSVASYSKPASLFSPKGRQTGGSQE